MAKSLIQVINNLGDNDCRKDYWRNIGRLLDDGQYGLVCELIKAHIDDIDYSEQCELIVSEIAKRSGDETAE